MLVEWTAAATAAFYAANIPIKLAVRFSRGPGSGGVTAGIAAFENRFALNAARRRKPKSGKNPISLQKLPAMAKAAGAGRYLRKHIHIDYLCLRGEIGLSDAMHTALLCGAVTSAARATAAICGARLSMHVAPDFSRPHVSGEICGIVSARAGHIIVAAAYGAIEYAKGRLQTWIHTRSKTS